MSLPENSASGAVPETFALLALMHFHAARLGARLDGMGGLLLLEEQDRSLWDRAAVTGRGIVASARPRSDQDAPPRCAVMRMETGAHCPAHAGQSSRAVMDAHRRAVSRPQESHAGSSSRSSTPS